MGNQLEFGSLAPGFRRFQTGDRILTLASEVVDYFGPKKVANDLGRRNHASIAYAVRPDRKARRGHRLYLEETAYFVEAHPSRSRVVEVLSSLVEEPSSEGEELAAILDVMHEYLGPELRKGLLSKAKRRLVGRKRRLK